MIKLLFLNILILNLYTSCSKLPLRFRINNIDNKIRALGHGGMGNQNLYPINTYESILNCIYTGSNGSEIDVQMTRDCVLVAFHDEQLNDMTNGSGRISDISWSELQTKQYDPANHVNYNIVRLDTLFSMIKNLQDYTFSFDHKLYLHEDRFDAFVGAEIRLIERFHLQNNVLIESGSEAFLTLFKRLRNDYHFFIHPSDFATGLAFCQRLNLSGIVINCENITANQITQAHSFGKYIQVYGPDDYRSNVASISKQADYIQTDALKSLVNLLD